MLMVIALSGLKFKHTHGEINPYQVSGNYFLNMTHAAVEELISNRGCCFFNVKVIRVKDLFYDISYSQSF